MTSRIKDSEGRLLTKKDEVLGRWREYFKDIMASGDSREAQISCWGMGR